MSQGAMSRLEAAKTELSALLDAPITIVRDFISEGNDQGEFFDVPVMLVMRAGAVLGEVDYRRWPEADIERQVEALDRCETFFSRVRADGARGEGIARAIFRLVDAAVSARMDDGFSHSPANFNCIEVPAG